MKLRNWLKPHMSFTKKARGTPGDGGTTADVHALRGGLESKGRRAEGAGSAS